TAQRLASLRLRAETVQFRIIGATGTRANSAVISMALLQNWARFYCVQCKAHRQARHGPDHQAQITPHFRWWSRSAGPVPCLRPFVPSTRPAACGRTGEHIPVPWANSWGGLYDRERLA